MKLSMLSIAVLVAAAVSPALAAQRCFHFDKLAEGSSWTVGDSVDMGNIGEVRVRDLLAAGTPVADNPANKFLKLSAAATAGGTSPEVYGKNVAVQMIPKEPASTISMKVSHQPGAEGARAAFVEVNGERHEFNGSLAQLNGKTIGGASKAKLKVDLPTTSGNFVSGRLKAESRDGIRSFTIGAMELHLDDVCLER